MLELETTCKLWKQLALVLPRWVVQAINFVYRFARVMTFSERVDRR